MNQEENLESVSDDDSSDENNKKKTKELEEEIGTVFCKKY